MYLVLIVILAIILLKFVADAWTFFNEMILVKGLVGYEFNQMIIRVLELLDLTLVANLVLIIILSGYENFVSKLEIIEHHPDRPDWIGRLDFSGLKLKIISSVVAISIIELLQDFLYISPQTLDPHVEFWRIIIHIIFVATGVVFAIMEILSEKRHEVKDKNILAEETTKGLKKYEL